MAKQVKAKKQTKQNTGKKKRRDPHETLTLKYWLGGAAAVAVLVGLVVLASVLLTRAERVKFVYADGMLTRTYDNRVFLKAPDCYEILFPLGNTYGESEDFPVYQVGFYNKYGVLSSMDDENYLTDSEHRFYYGNMVVLPTLDETEALLEFSADTVRFGEFEEDESFVVYFSSLTNKNAPDATDFVNEYLTGRRYVGDGLPQKTYRVQLTSAKYDYLSYILYLVECDNGDYYLYSPADKAKSIAMDAEWFDSFHQKPDTAVTTDK
ncbi:MAG: hypothetical protein IKC63_01005 [Clostridia bacterium]|nr:hypothetical protein [Clostridia bacterium]